MSSKTFKFPSIQEKYPEKKMCGSSLYVYEKIDGSNVSLRKYDDTIVPWSRSGPIGSSSRFYFDDFRRFVYGTLKQNTDIYLLPEELIVFGEFTHSGFGHINYGDQNTNRFFLLGIYNCSKEIFLPPSEVEEWTALLGLCSHTRRTPLLVKGEINKRDIPRLINQSQLYQGPPEGFVVHHYDSHFKNGLRLLRYYHPDFREVFPTLAGPEKYLTLKRFIKAGQKALIDGNDVTLDVILKNVTSDVLKEDDHSFNERELRSSVNEKRDMVQKKVLHLFH